MIRSLRLRLLLHTSFAAAIVLGLLGLALYLGVRRSVESEYNQSLLNEARAVAATAEQHGSQIVFDYAPDELPKFVTSDHPDYFQAWIDPDVVIRSPSLGQGNLPQALRPRRHQLPRRGFARWPARTHGRHVLHYHHRA